MTKTPLLRFLLDHAEEEPVSFHMPGHKGSGLFRKYGYGDFLDRIADMDITEIPGADNLFQTEGIIKEVQEKYAQLYGVKKSYILINGTSGGLIAAILAAVPPGRKLIMARNCHKSVFNGLTLGGVKPVYAYPEMMPEFGILGGVSPDEIRTLLSANPDADAVLLPSPNYYGVCSDIEGIAQAVHEAGKVLIVDQAHGAHLKFFGRFPEKGLSAEMPKPAEECGADIVVNSTHKTLASFTQSAVLNLNSHRVDPYILEDKLQAIESTSPSYILMASMDVNAAMLKEHGGQLIENWDAALERFYSTVNEDPELQHIKVIQGLKNYDYTKINIDLSCYGLTGNDLEDMLIKDRIYPELITGNILMLMTGIGNTAAHMDRLLASLKMIIKDRPLKKRLQGERPDPDTDNTVSSKAQYNPYRSRTVSGISGIKRWVDIKDAPGRVSAASIIPYPPGIPILCSGETFEEEDVAYIKTLRSNKEKVIGVNEKEQVLIFADNKAGHSDIGADTENKIGGQD